MSSGSKLFAAVALALLSLAAPAAAQCPTPDNLDGGPCCSITNVQLPTLPNFKDDAQNICWQDCSIDQVSLVRSKWKKLNVWQVGTVPPCGEQRMLLDITSPSNVLLWRGNINLIYSRTFWVIETSGLARQVWRFLANGDLRHFPAAGTPPCPVPSCTTSFNNRAYFSGYVDFAEDCSVPGGGSFDTAWMLTHACDAFDHHAGFPRAGTFHPDRSFSFVGPAAGFVPGPLQPIEGTTGSGFDNVRQRVPTPPPQSLACTFEEPVIHTLTPQNQLCSCGLPGSNQFMVGDLNIQGACGTSIRNPSSAPLLPGFVSMGIGMWTNPNLFPGQQSLRWNIGGYDVADCTGLALHHVFYGVTTLGGLTAFELTAAGPGNPLPPIFIDQSSANNAAGNPVMNRPHSSLHFIALNH